MKAEKGEFSKVADPSGNWIPLILARFSFGKCSVCVWVKTVWYLEVEADFSLKWTLPIEASYQ